MLVRDRTQPETGRGRPTDAEYADCPCRPCYQPHIVFGRAACGTRWREDCQHRKARHAEPADPAAWPFCPRCGARVVSLASAEAEYCERAGGEPAMRRAEAPTR